MVESTDHHVIEVLDIILKYSTTCNITRNLKYVCFSEYHLQRIFDDQNKQARIFFFLDIADIPVLFMRINKQLSILMR